MTAADVKRYTSAVAEASNLRVLGCLPGRACDIAKALGSTQAVIWWPIHRLHKAGRIHVEGWDTSRRGPPAAIWHAGPGEDAPKPVPSRKALSSRAYRRRLAETGELEDIRSRTRNRNATLYHCGKRDPLTKAFFGGTK